MYAFGAAILASMTSILMGYNIVVMSGAGIYIEKDLGIDDTKLEIVSGIINLYSLVGSTIAGRMSDWIGRRFTIIFAAAIFFASSLITCLAPNYAVLMVGRFFGGVGVGYALVIAPVYAAEVAPASARGFLSSLPEIFINGGILIGYLSNFAFSGLSTHLGWRVMFAVGAIPPIFLAAGVMFMPESPRWLVMQGRIEDARWVLDRTSDTPEEADFRLSEIQEAARLPTSTVADDPSAPLLSGRQESVWRELFIPSPQVRRVLIAAIGLQFFQQATGVDSVVLYNPRVLAKAGISSENVILGATVAVGAVKTGFILVATFLCDRVGRRPLLLTSVGGMVVSLLVLSTGLLVIDRHPDANLPWLAVLCVAMVIAFVGSFAVGLGPIAWVYTSEIFPLRLRAQGASLAAGTNRIISAVVTMSSLSLYNTITVAGSFYLYAAISAVTWVFIYLLLPETRGRSLEEMQVLFGGEKLKGREDERKSLVDC